MNYFPTTVSVVAFVIINDDDYDYDNYLFMARISLQLEICL